EGGGRAERDQQHGGAGGHELAGGLPDRESGVQHRPDGPEGVRRHAQHAGRGDERGGRDHGSPTTSTGRLRGRKASSANNEQSTAMPCGRKGVSTTAMTAPSSATPSTRRSRRAGNTSARSTAGKAASSPQ